MHGASVPLHTSGQRLLMRMQAWKRRQQRWVYVYQPAIESFDKTFGQNPHEARKQYVIRFVRVNGISQGSVKLLTRSILLMRHRYRLKPLFPCPVQRGSLGIVRYYGHHFAEKFSITQRLHDGPHIAAAARHQHDKTAAQRSI